jgi:hypothetical protein
MPTHVQRTIPTEVPVLNETTVKSPVCATTRAYCEVIDKGDTSQLTRTMFTDAYDFIAAEDNTTVYNGPPENIQYHDLTYGNDPNEMISIDGDSDWPASPAYTDTDSLWWTDCASAHSPPTTPWGTILPADTEHITSDIENIPPTSTEPTRWQTPGPTECTSIHLHSHGAEYVPPPYDEGDDNSTDRGGQSLEFTLPIPIFPGTNIKTGTKTARPAKCPRANYDQAARMLPHFPWDDDPGPSESTTKHQRDIYHPAAQVLPYFPSDDDPGSNNTGTIQ